MINRLTPAEERMMAAEAAGTPMHAGALAIFEGTILRLADGRIDIEAIREHIRSRLSGARHARQIVRNPSPVLGRSYWEDDEDFDIAYHVRLTALPAPGAEDQMMELMNRVQAQGLDPERPLWELWFVDGLPDGRVGIISKAHHCLVGEVGAVDVTQVIYDLVKKADLAPAAPWEPMPGPSTRALLTDAAADALGQPLAPARHAVDRISQTVSDVSGGVDRMLRNATSRQLVWDEPITAPRRFETCSIPLADARNVHEAAGVSLHAVVLSICSGGLRRFLEDRGSLSPHPVPITAPVSVTGVAGGPATFVGASVELVEFDLPVDEASASTQIELIHRELAPVASSGGAVHAAVLRNAKSFVPTTLLTRAASATIGLCPGRLVVLNVPGPRGKVYFMGSELVELYPYSGIADTQALSIAVLSYGDELRFGLTSDRTVVPDLEMLAGDLVRSAADLVERFTGSQAA